MTQKNSQMNPILAGSLAGGLGYFTTLPLDYLKQRIQTGTYTCGTGASRPGNLVASNNFLSAGRILSWESSTHAIRTLFKGGLIGSAAIVPQMALKFGTNHYLNKYTNNSAFMNGFISGYIDGSFLGPVLAVQSILQMQDKTDFKYRNAFQILQTQKASLMHFTFPLAMRNAAYTSVLFGGQHAFNNRMNYPLGGSKADENRFRTNFLLSSALNIPGVIACSPFDVIRANQIQYLLHHKDPKPWIITRDIYKQRGLRGFYQGFGALYVNFALRFPITFSLYYLLMH
jgi:hypothetical protein